MSMSQLCNAFQVIQGFFLKSVNAPERLINALSCSGWSISNQSIHNMIKSTTQEQKAKIRELRHSGLFAIAYDNLDFSFKTKQPTVENQGSFVSITTGTFIPLTHSATKADFEYSSELWDKSSLNLVGMEDTKSELMPSFHYIHECITNASPMIQSCTEWIILKIIVNALIPEFKKELGSMPSSLNIPCQQTVQIPAQAMHIKASTTDGNVEILKNMDSQLCDINGPKFDHGVYVQLVHGDLGTQE